MYDEDCAEDVRVYAAAIEALEVLAELAADEQDCATLLGVAEGLAEIAADYYPELYPGGVAHDPVWWWNFTDQLAQRKLGDEKVERDRAWRALVGELQSGRTVQGSDHTV